MTESITITNHRQCVTQPPRDYAVNESVDDDDLQDEYNGVPLGVESTLTHLESTL